MNRVILLLPLAIAACATPREQCIGDSLRQVRTLSALAQETRANIARGYGIEEYQEVREVRVSCNKIDDGGVVYSTFCDEVEVTDRTRPVALNLAEEQQKLQSLENRIRQEQQQVDARIAACNSAFPE